MGTTIQATFEITNWDEQPLDGSVGGSKLTRASVTKRYAGDVDGTSTTEWLMAYRPDSTAAFVGLERVTGTVGGRPGTLVLQHVGTFRDGAATATLTVVTGTDDLAGATGTGDFVADPGGRITLTLEG
jgi:hypothetical protein